MSVAFFLVLLVLSTAASRFPAATSPLSCSPALILAGLQRGEVEQVLLFGLGPCALALVFLRVLLLLVDEMLLLISPPLCMIHISGPAIVIRIVFIVLVLSSAAAVVGLIGVVARFLGRTSAPLFPLLGHGGRNDAHTHVGALRGCHAGVWVMLVAMARVHHVRGHLSGVRSVVRGVVLLSIVLRLRIVLELVALRWVALRRVLLVMHLLLMVVLHW